MNLLGNRDVYPHEAYRASESARGALLTCSIPEIGREGDDVCADLLRTRGGNRRGGGRYRDVLVGGVVEVAGLGTIHPQVGYRPEASQGSGKKVTLNAAQDDDYRLSIIDPVRPADTNSNAGNFE